MKEKVSKPSNFLYLLFPKNVVTIQKFHKDDTQISSAWNSCSKGMEQLSQFFAQNHPYGGTEFL